MKKFLYSVCALAAGLSGAFAQSPANTSAIGKLSPAPSDVLLKAQADDNNDSEPVTSLDFSLAFELYGATAFNGVNAGTTVYQAFEFSEANRKLFAGKKISAVNIYSGTNLKTGKNDMTNVTIFLTQDLNEKFFYTQAGKLGTARYTQYSIPLDTPYEIDPEKPLYVGYYTKVMSDNSQYLVADAVPRDVPDGGYCGFQQKDKIEWNNVAATLGNLCIGVTLTGEDFPMNGVNLYSVSLPPYAEPGKSFPFEFTVIGAACNKAESIEVTYTVGDSEPVEIEVPFDENLYLGYNETGTYTLYATATAESGIDVPFNIEVTKVNGQPNIATQNKGASSTVIFPRKNGYERNFIIEEGTGTWCQWCPAGIVMMENIKNKYPERFVRVALHGNDAMSSESTYDILSYFAGLPAAMINRGYEIAPTSPNVMSDISGYYNYFKNIPSLARISDIAVAPSAGKTIEIKSGVDFGIDYANNDRYRMSYYVTEDNVGPYAQVNSYAGGQNGTMGGWEKKDSPVLTMYDDVARLLIGGASGIEGSLPAKVEVGGHYEYTIKADVSNVENPNYYVTAMVVDSGTGQIVNVKQISVTDGSFVESVSKENITVLGGSGSIKINGNYSEACVYDMAGMAVAVLGGEESVSVAGGLYIVVCDGKSYKVVVK